MALELYPPHSCYARQFKAITKKHKKSNKSIDETVERLLKNHFEGDKHEGLCGVHEVRKIRIKLEGLGSSKSLRFIYIVKKNFLIRVALYFKSDYKRDEDAVNMIKENLKIIAKEIREESQEN